jgi:transcriptional regulator with XRE-family HTH domain
MPKIKFLRLKLGLTQGHVATALGVHQPDLSAFELMTRRPGPIWQKRFSDFYGLPWESLAGTVDLNDFKLA